MSWKDCQYHAMPMFWCLRWLKMVDVDSRWDKRWFHRDLLRCSAFSGEPLVYFLFVESVVWSALWRILAA